MNFCQPIMIGNHQTDFLLHTLQLPHIGSIPCTHGPAGGGDDVDVSGGGVGVGDDGLSQDTDSGLCFFEDRGLSMSHRLKGEDVTCPPPPPLTARSDVLPNDSSHSGGGGGGVISSSVSSSSSSPREGGPASSRPRSFLSLPPPIHAVVGTELTEPGSTTPTLVPTVPFSLLPVARGATEAATIPGDWVAIGSVDRDPNEISLDDL